MKRRNYLKIILVIIVTFILSSCIKNDPGIGNTAAADTSALAVQKSLGDHEIAFSKPGYFYSKDIKLNIISKKPCTIYYTTDGKEPDKKQNKYNNGIKLSAGKNINVVSIKARGYYKDGSKSNIIVHSYFMGKNIDTRFNTLVFSVTTNPYNLYDDKYGIFVEGKRRRDYIKNNPRTRIDQNSPANYNIRGKKSERPVYLEILESNGKSITSQNAGIRTYGGWSRGNKQKSIKIYLRKKYDKKNTKLKYEFFPDKKAANGDGTIPDKFNRLVLRDCGNDIGQAFIRDELFETLGAQAGYKDYEAVRPAALFINGEYCGFYWMHEVYCDEYFKQNYGKYSGKFEIVEGSETKKDIDEDKKNEKAVKDYDAMYAYSKLDLTDDKNYSELCKLVDVDNYLSYYALELYINNDDWPSRNYKTYRYYAKDGEKYGEAPFDGKWRYMLHDLDFSFGLYGMSNAHANNIEKYLGDGTEVEDVSPLFGQLMKRKDCREIFIKKTLDLMNGAFAESNISKVMYKMNASRINELSHMYNTGIVDPWLKPEALDGQLDAIKKYGGERVKYILEKYQKYFKLGDIYKVIAQPAAGCKLKINSFLTDEHFEGSYYTDYNTEITAVIPSGKKLDYWLCNGKKIYDEKLVITPKLLEDGAASVSFVLK